MEKTEEQKDLMDRLRKAIENANTEAAKEISEKIDIVAKDTSITPGLKSELDLIKEQQMNLNPNAEAYINANLNANGAGISGNVDANSPGQTRPSEPGASGEEPDKPKSSAPTPFSKKNTPGGR